MQQFTDQLGITYSASDATSIDVFNHVIELYLESRNDVMPELDELLKKDPDMPMAHCFRAYLLKFASDPRLSSEIDRQRKILTSVSDRLNNRERQHLEALIALSSNQPDQAINILESLLESYPKDMLALRVNHHLHFYSGNANNMRGSVDRSVQHWKPEDPFYSFLLGMHSFGLEESAMYSTAEETGRLAIEYNKNDLWAAHAVTHVMHMQARYLEGIDWLDTLLPEWTRANNFLYHLYWHKALFHIGLADHASALAVFDTFLVKPLADDFYLDVCNASSLLWRLEMHGIDVGDRWHALESYSIKRIQDDELVFVTLHYLMTPARLQNTQLTQQALNHFETWSRQETTQGAVVNQVGLPLAKAIISLGKGEYQQAASTINQIQNDIVNIGGSHAQRHLFEQMKSFAQQKT